MDLSFPHAASVNSGIPKTHYLDNEFQLCLPGIDRLCEFIISKGSGCYVYKKDLKRAYRQFPIDPKDHKYLGFTWDGVLYFDTRCPFRLRSSPLVCQQTTRAVIHVVTKEGYTADVYLDDFYGAEHPADSHFAFARLQDLFDELGLQSSPEKDCHPSTRMICLGILVDTEKMLFEVPADRLSDPQTELLQWTQFSTMGSSVFNCYVLPSLNKVVTCVLVCLLTYYHDKSVFGNLLSAYVAGLKNIITSRFNDCLSELTSFSIFSPVALPKPNSPELKEYGNRQIRTLADHIFWRKKGKRKTS